MPGAQSIEGLASNLNTTQIVQAIMQVEHQTVDLLEADKATKTNQIAVYNALSAKLVAFKLQASALSRAATYDVAKVSVSDDTYLSATAKGKISPGQYRLSVLQLAQNHQIASQGFAASTDAVGTGTFTIQVGSGSGGTVTIDGSNNSLVGLKDAINAANAGVKAAIVSDGSSSKPFRLVLTADDPGAANTISVTASLSGGTAPNFAASSFDSPELLQRAAGSTSAIALGAGAAFTGSQNKTYTFAVQGSGLQTVGTGTIDINWTDGTNSGTIAVTAAGGEVALAGAGSEGLSLSFGAGALTAGDTFQVQTFSPLLQAAQDAKVTLGSSGSGGSPIVVSSPTNLVDNLIPNVSVKVQKVSDAQTPFVTVDVNSDTDGIKAKIQSFIDAYNAAMDEIDKQFKYDADTKEVGVLFGDTTLLTAQNQLKAALQTQLSGATSSIRLLSQLGIRHSSQGNLYIADSAALDKALTENLDGLTKFFINSAGSTSSKIVYQDATSKTRIPSEGFAVNITAAASSGYLKGTVIDNPASAPLVLDSSAYRLKLRVDGLESDEIALTQKSYTSLAELATELQNKIDADPNLGDKNLTVEYIDLGATGYLRLNAASFGESSRVEIQAGVPDSALIKLGLASAESVAGHDVEGTINGEPAEGVGQLLTGKKGNQYSEGLSVKVLLGNDELDPDGPEATINLVKGFATQLDDLLDRWSAAGEGVLARHASALQRQIDNVDKTITAEEARLKIREASLFNRYQALESALGQWNTTSEFLSAQLGNLSTNWRS